MGGQASLNIYRNFIRYSRDENDQARLTPSASNAKKGLTSHDVSGTNWAIGRGFERFTRYVGGVFRLLGHKIAPGTISAPDENFRVRQDFVAAIRSELSKCGIDSLDALPKVIRDKFKGEMETNKPLTKRRIRLILNEVDSIVAYKKQEAAVRNTLGRFTKNLDGLNQSSAAVTKLREEFEAYVKTANTALAQFKTAFRDEIPNIDALTPEKALEVLKEKAKAAPAQPPVGVEVGDQPVDKLLANKLGLGMAVKSLESNMEKLPPNERGAIDEPIAQKKNELAWVTARLAQKLLPQIGPTPELLPAMDALQKKMRVLQKAMAHDMDQQTEKAEANTTLISLDTATDGELKAQCGILKAHGEEIGKTNAENEKKIAELKDELAGFQAQVDKLLGRSKPEPPKTGQPKNGPEPPAVGRGGVLLKDSLPVKSSKETQAQYNGRLNRLIREGIIPHEMPNLKNALAQLRRQTIAQLGIEKELEPWFDAEWPKFNVDSEVFMEIARQEINASADNAKFADIERAILAKCRLKDDIKFIKEGGVSCDKKLVLRGPGELNDEKEVALLDQPDGKLTLEAYDRKVQAFSQDNGFARLVNTDATIRGLLVKAQQIRNINEAFKGLRQQQGVIEKLVNDTIEEGLRGSQEILTEDERTAIAGAIRDKVLTPLKDAQDVWSVRPASYMSKLIEKCVQNRANEISGETVKAAIKGIASALVRRQFPAVDIQGANAKCLFKGQPQDQGKESPGAVIEAAIGGNRGIRQKGPANCFMVSLVNALLGNVRGRAILRECFCKDDGLYHFKDGFGKAFTVSNEDVNAMTGQFNGMQGDQMSALERVIWTAWLKCQESAGLKIAGLDAKLMPGAQRDVNDFAFLFGLTNDSGVQPDENVGISLPDTRLTRWAKTGGHLASGQIAIVHEGEIEGGHYRTITGINKGQNGEKIFQCCDSLLHESQFTLDALKNEGDEGGRRRIILLNLPQ